MLVAWSVQGTMYPNDSWSFGIIIEDAQKWLGSTLLIEVDPTYALTDSDRSNNYSSLKLE